MKLARIGVLAATTVLVVAGCSSSTASGGGTKTLKIGTELPMSGAETANGEPTANGVKLAIKQANAHNMVPGYTLDISVQDDAVNGAHDPQQGATNMHTLVSDPSVVGVVGPFNSSVAQAEIPISNAGGLTQCSPANTNTGLTYPPDSAQYRPNNPDKINYIRVAAPDSIQGPAGADFVYNDLGAHSVYILDDTETFGVGVGDAFAAEFTKLRRHDHQARQCAQVDHRLHPALHRGSRRQAGGRLPRRHDPDGHGPCPQAGPHGCRLRDHPVHGS